MAEKNNDVIDVRGLQPWERHKIILEKYKALKPNEKMQIINDHYPVHLIHFMKHEFKNFDESFCLSRGLGDVYKRQKKDSIPFQFMRQMNTA